MYFPRLQKFCKELSHLTLHLRILKYERPGITLLGRYDRSGADHVIPIAPGASSVRCLAGARLLSGPTESLLGAVHIPTPAAGY
jgi:hypothetical protein